MNLIRITQAGDKLLEAIKSKNAEQTIIEIKQFKQNMRDKTLGADHVLWITDPENLNRVHNSLVEDLNIPARLLSIKRASYNRTQRAVLLFQAMEIAMKKVYPAETELHKFD